MVDYNSDHEWCIACLHVVCHENFTMSMKFEPLTCDALATFIVVTEISFAIGHSDLFTCADVPQHDNPHYVSSRDELLE